MKKLMAIVTLGLVFLATQPSYARNYPCSGKKVASHTVHLMANLFAMTALSVNQNEFALKTDYGCFKVS